MGVEERLHQLEIEFRMNASDILDIVLRNNRLHVALRGAVAQEHLRKYLDVLREEEKIDDFEQIDRDGLPDFRVTFEGSEHLIKCKNVEKQRGAGGPITIDFWRTRRPTGGSHLRYYHEGEFQILGACLFNRTGKWEFRFIRTEVLTRLPDHPDRFHNRVRVDRSASYGEFWSSDLVEVLRQLSG